MVRQRTLTPSSSRFESLWASYASTVVITMVLFCVSNEVIKFGIVLFKGCVIMYEIQSRIRFSETDIDGYLTVPAIINYFQDISTFQSVDVGAMDMDEDGHPLGWIILSWDIKIDKLPKLGETVSVKTYPLKQNGPFAYRDFTMSIGNDVIIRAHSIWSIIDLDRLMPRKITDEIMGKYGVDEPLPGKWAGRKLPIPKNKMEAVRFVVRSFQIDKNGHMNNERYVSAAIALLPEGTQIKEVQVGYVAQALLNDEIIIYRGLNQEKADIVSSDVASEQKQVFDMDTEVFNLEKVDGSTLCTVILKK